MQNWVARLRHVQNNLFISDCQYFHNEMTFVRTTEVKQCVLITKIVKITKIALFPYLALYFLKTALLAAKQNWDMFSCILYIYIYVNNFTTYITLHNSVLGNQVNLWDYSIKLLKSQPSSLAAYGWIAKDADQRSQVERGIGGALGSRHTTTNHGSQLRSGCWFYGGRKTGEPGENPRSTGEINYSNSTHMSSK